jgi:N-acetylglucosamine-6-phosphate deacetylase
MVRTMLKSTTASLPDVIRMASLTPAERVGMGDRIGSLALGKRADILVLTESLEVERVFIGGEEYV